MKKGQSLSLYQPFLVALCQRYNQLLIHFHKGRTVTIWHKADYVGLYPKLSVELALDRETADLDVPQSSEWPFGELLKNVKQT